MNNIFTQGYSTLKRYKDKFADYSNQRYANRVNDYNQNKENLINFGKGYMSSADAPLSDNTYQSWGNTLANYPTPLMAGAVGLRAGAKGLGKADDLARVAGKMTPEFEAMLKFGKTTHFGRRIGGKDMIEVLFKDSNGNHIGSRFYDNANDAQNGMDRYALRSGVTGYPRQLGGGVVEPSVVREYISNTIKKFGGEYK